MSLTLQEVEHIATLARLKLTEEQKALYREQLSAILEYVARLQELDTTNVSPSSGGRIERMPLRKDEPRPGLGRDELLINTEHQQDDQFKIPPVFE